MAAHPEHTKTRSLRDWCAAIVLSVAMLAAATPRHSSTLNPAANCARSISRANSETIVTIGVRMRMPSRSTARMVRQPRKERCARYGDSVEVKLHGYVVDVVRDGPCSSSVRMWFQGSGSGWTAGLQRIMPSIGRRSTAR